MEEAESINEEEQKQENDNSNEKRPFKNFAYGLFVVKSKNSNFNADFSGLPRRLPDKEGTIYATDKALKYCIRKYLHEFEGSDNVFVWRRKKLDEGDITPLDIGENYERLFPSIKEQDKKGSKDKTPSKEEILRNLLSCIDVRLFGVTYAKGGGDNKTNVSIHGPIQISYGVNKLSENVFYTSDILSPYRNPKDDSTSKQEKKQTTIGNETKALESHYVYDIVINTNHLNESIENTKVLEKNNEKNEEAKNEGQEDIKTEKTKENKFEMLSTKDIGLFKKAICRGVNYVNSCSKIGSESELFLYVEFPPAKNEKGKILPLMKDLITISKGNADNRTVINLSRLTAILPKGSHTIELYYDPTFTKVKLGDLAVTEKHILSLESLQNSEEGNNKSKEEDQKGV